MDEDDLKKKKTIDSKSTKGVQFEKHGYSKQVVEEIHNSLPPGKYTEIHVAAVNRIQSWFLAIKERRKKMERIRERLYAKMELQENDGNYLGYMKTIFDEFLTEEEHRNIFSNFDEVFDVAREVNIRINERSFVGLREVIGLMKVNSRFVENYSFGMGCLKRLVKECRSKPNDLNSVKILSIVDTEDERTCGLNLQNLLIKPFSRIVSYENIGNYILRNTPKESHEYEIIQDILLEIRNICDFINHNRRIRMDKMWLKNNNIEEVSAIEKSLNSLFQLRSSTKSTTSGLLSGNFFGMKRRVKRRQRRTRKERKLEKLVEMKIEVMQRLKEEMIKISEDRYRLEEERIKIEMIFRKHDEEVSSKRT